MDLNLKDKIVVISGGGGKKGSIGETILQNLVGEGAIPALLDANDRGKEYIDELKTGLFLKTDVTDPEQVERSMQRITSEFDRIDVVINNVGVNDGVGLNGSYEEFMESLKLNLSSYFLVVKHAHEELIKSKGNILNIGSKVALTGQGGTSAYAAAKGGILALTREWAVDLVKHGVRSNAIIIAESWTPSYDAWISSVENGQKKLEQIKSKIPLEKRMTTPQEIADQVLFLISDRASHITGQHVFVDGGYVHLDRSLLTDS